MPDSVILIGFRVMSGSDKLSRRDFLQVTGTGVLVATMGAVISPPEAWGLQVRFLKPDTMKTLIAIARDIYPHDRLADRYYANAVKAYDEASGRDTDLRALIEQGVARVDELAMDHHARVYVELPWEDRRVAILEEVQAQALFVKLRRDLRISLYGEQAVWAVLGYEGESFSRGGYLEHGFDDIEWL